MRRRNTFIKIIAVIIFATAAFAGGFYLESIRADEEIARIREANDIEIQSLKAQIPEKTEGYVLNKELNKGSEITEKDIVSVEFDKSISPDTLEVNRANIIGKRIKISAGLYSLITSDLLYEDKDIPADLREQQFSYIKLPDRLESGDVVDIRIKFPTGQDYVLLSKKDVIDIARIMSSENEITKQTVWTSMNEKEIVRMGSATVDAYLSGATIYAIEYMEPIIQPAATVNYPENANVLELINNNANLIEAAKFNLEVNMRSELDKSLVQYIKTDGQKIATPTEEFQQPIVESPISGLPPLEEAVETDQLETPVVESTEKRQPDDVVEETTTNVNDFN